MPSSACKKSARSEEHTSELQSHDNLVCRLLLAKKDKQLDQAAASSEFSLAHCYEEMMPLHGRSAFPNKAIAEYRLAFEHDPPSEYLNASLAELDAKTG